MGLQKVCAVIVTYNIGKEFLKCFNSIKDQVDNIIIVDNGSDIETLSVLKKLTDEYGNNKLTIFYNGTNKGIANALNIGIKCALKKKYRWILTLDHDSEASPNMINELLTARKLLNDQNVNNIGIVAANPYDINGNKYLYRELRCSKKKLIKTDMVISSGCLINSKIFEEVGYFKEPLFVYYVDNDFCLRCVDKGWNIYIYRSAILYHQEGKKEGKKLLWMKVTYDNYNYYARYYISRNLVYILKKHWYGHPIRCSRSFLRLFWDIFKVILYDNNKIKNIKITLKGLCDGIMGKYGKLYVKL